MTSKTRIPIHLQINGHRHELEVEPRVTLLDALRNQLNLTGVKRVCDRGSCGACTTIVGPDAIHPTPPGRGASSDWPSISIEPSIPRWSANRTGA
jgi:ferredoxin